VWFRGRYRSRLEATSICMASAMCDLRYSRPLVGRFMLVAVKVVHLDNERAT